MSSDQSPPSKPLTLPGFPKTDPPAPASAPVRVSHGRIGNAKTELAIPKATLSASAISLAEAVHSRGHDAVALVESTGDVHLLSAGAPILETLGYSLDEFLAAPASFLEEHDDIRLLAAYRALAEEPGKRSSIRFQCLDSEGELVELEAHGHNLAWAPAGAVVIHVGLPPTPTEAPPSRSDILPQLERVEDRETFIQHAQSVVDRKVAKVWSAPKHARAVMRDRRWDYALMLIYLDRFNILLGGFGTDALTEICVEACTRIRSVLRGGDAVAPVGATEIAVLLEGVSDEDHIHRLADLALETFKASIAVDGAAVRLVPIAGVATSGRQYTDAGALLLDAAAAAGRALLRGHGAQHEVFQTQFRTETVQRMSLMADLRDGIARGELFLLFQPVLSLVDGSYTALEAFVRWQHPKLGLVMPGDFIPMAEETGLIRPLTEWVLNAGCTTMMSIAKHSELRIHINVGAAELSEKDFLSSVTDALEKSELAADRLCLDMSESALVDSSEHANETMHRLGAKGVRFALDDYGTGASSLRYLADLPFDYVKIDTTISQQVGDTHRRIARAMISLAHELERKVIAEGVESESQRDNLAALGSDEAQGYFFAKPLDVEKITQLLGASS